MQATRKSLGPDAVFLGFHTGEPESWLWAITQDRVEFLAIAGEADLRKEILEFVRNLREASPARTEVGRQLLQHLFGKVSPHSLSRQNWVIAPDGPLFELPFEALTEQAPGGPSTSSRAMPSASCRVLSPFFEPPPPP